jgi:hypothetical protein
VERVLSFKIFRWLFFECRLWAAIQPVDATHALNTCSGVSGVGMSLLSGRQPFLDVTLKAMSGRF